MIVTCPGCSAKYRVKDQAVPQAGAKMKCPKCGKFFAAHRVNDDESAVPQPVLFDGKGSEAQDGSAPVTESAGREWDSMMKADGLVLAKDPTAASDPFYKANPAVAERPSAADLGGGFSQDVQMHSPDQGFSPTAGDRAGAAEEVSDPFAHIDLTAPASQPLAGDGSSNPRAESVAAAAQSSPPTTAPAPVSGPIPTPATPPGADSAPIPKTSAGITVRDREGELHSFKYLPPARQWVAAHPDPEGLEVSIAGAPFAKVTMTHAFADLSQERDKAAAVATKAPTSAVEQALKSASAAGMETFPPPASPSVLEQVDPEPPSRAAKAGLFAAIALVGLVGIYMLWQLEVLPIEPFATETISSLTGAHSPLVVPPADPENEVEVAIEAAVEAHGKGSLALAVVNYRRALSFKRKDPEILRQLARCYTELGDSSAAAELRRIAPSAFAEDPAPVVDPAATE